MSVVHHASGDEGGQCVACDMEPEDAPPKHEAEVAGTDQIGPYCYCGHDVVVEPEA
jgi:hypothetical protein